MLESSTVLASNTALKNPHFDSWSRTTGGGGVPDTSNPSSNLPCHSSSTPLKPKLSDTMDINKILLYSWNIHHIYDPGMGAKFPLKGNRNDPGSSIPLIISKIYALLELFLLKITKEIFIPRHMEWFTTVKIPHASHGNVGHACNEREIKFELWS